MAAEKEDGQSPEVPLRARRRRQERDVEPEDAEEDEPVSGEDVGARRTVARDPRERSEEKEWCAGEEVVPAVHPDGSGHVDVLHFVDLVDPMTDQIERENTKSERSKEEQRGQDPPPGLFAHRRMIIGLPCRA